MERKLLRFHYLTYKYNSENIKKNGKKEEDKKVKIKQLRLYCIYIQSISPTSNNHFAIFVPNDDNSHFFRYQGILLKAFGPRYENNSVEGFRSFPSVYQKNRLVCINNNVCNEEFSCYL